MIKKKTVFILGAGASAPYGFPLGEKLLSEIARELVDDAPGNNTGMGNDLRAAQFPSDGDKFRVFGRALLASSRSSIDAFLEARSEFLDVGKAVIARQLLLREHGENRSVIPEECWDKYLFNKILGGSADAFSENQLRVITFNFDHSFEQLLWECLRENYPAASLRSVIPILHVHGELPEVVPVPVPHFHFPGDRADYLRGQRLLGMREAVSRIKIVHEEPNVAFEQANKWLEWAETICFLGFGYHSTNLQRLQIRQFSEGRATYGTAFKMPAGERTAVEAAVPGIRLTPKDHDILRFFQETDVIHG